VRDARANPTFPEATVPLRNLIILTVAALVVLAIIVVPGSAGRAPQTSTVAAATPPHAPSAPLRAHGASAPAAAAVFRLDGALRAGDVAALCRPGAILTPAVVTTLRQEGQSCEADVEAELARGAAEPLTLTSITTERDMATAQVRAPAGPDVPLTLLRDGNRWLVSYSHGGDPITALVD
jgi:hypothetical protein